MNKLLAVCLFLLSAIGVSAETSLERCMELAAQNYPIIKKYDLLSATENLELSDINKGWLPRVGVYAQGTAQNVVPAFPSSLTGMIQQMGGEIRGLGKLQYKVGVDINQTIWDGGVSKSRREVERRRTEVSRAALDVEMYGIRQRVQSIYFGILLLESQIEQSQSAIEVYNANLDRLKSMVRNGAAMQSDADVVEAQLLTLGQQIAQAKSAVKGYRDMLSLFTGEDMLNETLLLPDDELPVTQTSDRPELKLFDSQLSLNNAQRKTVDATLMPKVGFFAQVYYGYPGIDYFKAMTGRDLTFNILAGVKVSWNIDGFYTKRNSMQKFGISDRMIEADKETFMFNTDLQSASQREEISGLRSLMKDDRRIVELRKNVRMTAESQLRNGTIDATALTIKINDETQAQLQSAYHRILYIQAIYNLKNTLNR